MPPAPYFLKVYKLGGHQIESSFGETDHRARPGGARLKLMPRSCGGAKVTVKVNHGRRRHRTALPAICCLQWVTAVLVPRRLSCGPRDQSSSPASLREAGEPKCCCPPFCR